MVIKLDEKKMFRGSTTPPDPDQHFCDTMLRRDMFAVANLVIYHKVERGIRYECTIAGRISLRITSH